MRRRNMLLFVLGPILVGGCFSDPSSTGSASDAGEASDDTGDDDPGDDDTGDDDTGDDGSDATSTASTGSSDSGGVDCAGVPGGDAVEDECGVCEGLGAPCVGCTNPAASNYDPLATLDDDSCSCMAAGGGEPDQAVEDSNAGGGGLDQWQSFTAGVSGGLTRVDLAVYSPLGEMDSPGTIRIYEGEGTAGSELHLEDVVFAAGMDEFQQFELSLPVVVAEGSVYTIRFGVPEMTVGWTRQNSGDVYPQGASSLQPDDDFLFRTLVAPCVPG